MIMSAINISKIGRSLDGAEMMIGSDYCESAVELVKQINAYGRNLWQKAGRNVDTHLRQLIIGKIVVFIPLMSPLRRYGTDKSVLCCVTLVNTLWLLIQGIQRKYPNSKMGVNVLIKN